MKKKLLSALAALMVCGGVSAQTWTWQSETPAAGDWHLYHVSSGKFMYASTVDLSSGDNRFLGRDDVTADKANLFTVTDGASSTIKVYIGGTQYGLKENNGNLTLVTSGESTFYFTTNGENTFIKVTNETPGEKYNIFMTREVRLLEGDTQNGVLTCNLPKEKTYADNARWWFISPAQATAYRNYMSAYKNANEYSFRESLTQELKDKLDQVVAANNSASQSDASTKTQALNDVVTECNAYIANNNNSNLDIPVNSPWIAGQGKLGTYDVDATETYGKDAKDNDIEFSAGKVIYQNVEGLVNGKYEVKFYASANMVWHSFASGDNIAQVFANEVVEPLAVVDRSSETGHGDNTTDPDAKENLKTLEVNVTNGTLQFGIQNITNGGNWYLCKFVSLTLLPADDVVTLSVKANKYGTFVAPYAVTLPNGVSAYSVEVNGEYVALNKIANGGESLAAGNPVVLKNETGSPVSVDYKGASATGTVQANGLVGFYEADLDIPANSYVLQTQNGVQQFYKVTGAFTGSKNRCYLPADPAGVKVLSIDGEETAIEEIFGAEKLNGQIYDLNGRRVSKPGKGIYVVNGKKVLF